MAPDAKRVRRSTLSAHAQTMPGQPRLLTAVSVVYASHPTLSGLPHAARSIDEFLDCTRDRWTLENVINASEELQEAALVRLLDRLLVFEWSGLSNVFRMERFLENVNQAGQKNKMRVVDWWLTKYLPRKHSTIGRIISRATYWGRVHVLQWLTRKGVTFKPKQQSFMECRHASTAYWLHNHGYSLSIDVELEIGRNNLKFITWLYEHRERHIIRDLEKGIVLAASINSVPMAQLLTGTFSDTQWDEPDNNMNAQLNIKMVHWLETQFDWDDGTDDAGFGFWFNENSEREAEADSAHRRWVNHTIAIAARTGQLDVVEYLFDHEFHQPSCELMFSAARNGHMNVVQWLHAMEPICSDSAVGFAAKGGHFEIVKWLHKRSMIGSRALTDRLWRHDHPSKRSIDHAAKSGSLQLVQWLHKHRPDECSVVAMENAASYGHLDILRWLHANRAEGCTSDTLYQAVCNEYLDIVQWLFENPMKCAQRGADDHLLMDTAASYGNTGIVKWLHEARSAKCSTNAVVNAAEIGCFDTVKYLLESVSKHCPRAALDNAASYGHLEIVRFMIESGFVSCADPANDEPDDDDGIGYRPINDAIEFGHVEIVKYLFEHHQLRCSEHAIREAGMMKYFAVLEWVMKNDSNFANHKYKPLRGFTERKRETRRYLKRAAWPSNSGKRVE